MKYFIGLILFAFFISCSKEQPEVVWIKIDSWEFLSNPDAVNEQGELSHDFSHVFLNMDGKSLGVYELPAKIPVIADNGSHEFILLPGVVSHDGMSAIIERYPFAERYVENLETVLNDTIQMMPTTRYYSSTNFLIEDFESPSMQLDVAEESLTTLGRNNDPDILQWGNNYGQILLNEVDSVITFMTTFETVLPKFGTDVYLEFDYLNTNSMLTSIISYGGGEFNEDPFHIIKEQEKDKAVWKHAYYNLKKVIGFRQSSPINEAQFQLLLDVGETSSYFYIDNIKIIYP